MRISPHVIATGKSWAGLRKVWSPRVKGSGVNHGRGTQVNIFPQPGRKELSTRKPGMRNSGVGTPVFSVLRKGRK